MITEKQLADLRVNKTVATALLREQPKTARQALRIKGLGRYWMRLLVREGVIEDDLAVTTSPTASVRRGRGGFQGIDFVAGEQSIKIATVAAPLVGDRVDISNLAKTSTIQGIVRSRRWETNADGDIILRVEVSPGTDNPYANLFHDPTPPAGEPTS